MVILINKKTGMRKTALIFILIHSLAIQAFSQYSAAISNSRLPAILPHYQPEYTFDKPLDPAAWKGQKSGLHAAFGSTDRLYFRTEVPQQTAASFTATAWKGERLNAQLLVWSPDTLRQLRVTAADLVNENGKTISSKHIKLQLVRYVLSNYPYGAKDAVCGESPYKEGYLMPDRFEALDRFDLPGQTIRPLWLSLDLPADAEQGTYTGKVLVSTEKQTDTLHIKLKVQQQVLPSPHEWRYRLDLWQNPWAVAWYNHLTPWSPEHKALLKQHLQLYADAGGKYITTYGVHSPWADNSYLIEGGMIEWIKQQDGGWQFDYAIFDEYVEMAMDLGIDKAITLYTPVPWGNRFRYMDAATGNYVYETWAPGTETYTARWHTFLTDFKAHLEKKGWFKKVYLGINENEMEQTLAAIKVMKAHSPEWRITYAGNWHKELDTLLDDYSYLYGKEPTQQELKQRAARGASSTYYVCCNPAKPNNFVFSPPIEGSWISWYAAACGYDGFLRWAYDAWPEDPVRDARHGSWPAGDCYLVYPGGNSSIRYEKLREGIADYEKIRILREQAAVTGNKTVKQLWQSLEQHLKTFTTEHDFDEKKITADVNKGRDLVAALSDALTR
jgi:hypothetical protein